MPGKGSVQVLHQSHQRCSVRFQQYRRLSPLQIRQTRLNEAATLPTRSLAGTVFYKNNILSARPAIGSFSDSLQQKQGKAYLLRRCFPCSPTYPFPLRTLQIKMFFLEINTTLLHVFCYKPFLNPVCTESNDFRQSLQPEIPFSLIRTAVSLAWLSRPPA